MKRTIQHMRDYRANHYQHRDEIEATTGLRARHALVLNEVDDIESDLSEAPFHLVAERLHMDKSMLSAVAADLVDAGLMVRLNDPTRKGAACCYRVTDIGVEVLGGMRKAELS